MTITVELAEDYQNNLIAAGAVILALCKADVGLDPLIVMNDGEATITVKPYFMKSRYRLTVERVPDEEQVERVPDEEQVERVPDEEQLELRPGPGAMAEPDDDE